MNCRGLESEGTMSGSHQVREAKFITKREFVAVAFMLAAALKIAGSGHDLHQSAQAERVVAAVHDQVGNRGGPGIDRPRLLAWTASAMEQAVLGSGRVACSVCVITGFDMRIALNQEPFQPSPKRRKEQERKRGKDVKLYRSVKRAVQVI